MAGYQFLREVADKVDCDQKYKKELQWYAHYSLKYVYFTFIREGRDRKVVQVYEQLRRMLVILQAFISIDKINNHEEEGNWRESEEEVWEERASLLYRFP